MFFGGNNPTLELGASPDLQSAQVNSAPQAGSEAGSSTRRHAVTIPRPRRVRGPHRSVRQLPSPQPSKAARRHTKITSFAALHAGTDLLAAAVAAAFAFYLRFGASATTSPQLRVDLACAIALPLLWVAAASFHRAYDPRFTGVGTAEYRNLGRAFVTLVVMSAVVSYAFNLDVARSLVGLVLVPALLLSWLGRFVTRMWLRKLRRDGRAMHRVLAVGSAESVATMAATMHRDSSSGLRVVAACLSGREARDPAVRTALAEHGVEVAGDFYGVTDAVERTGARVVSVSAGDVGTDRLRSISWELEHGQADLIVSSGLSEVDGGRVHVQTFNGTPMLRVDKPVYVGFRRLCKTTFDRTAAFVALLVLMPAIMIIAALVRMDSPGPAFFVQERVGRRGRRFRMIKFRSMRVDAEAELATLAAVNEADDGVLFKIREDPRVTPVGRVLRRLSLDELPQLFNVLSGSMSLVGPRPPLPSEVARYDQDVSRRLLVRPGLTGLWQVSGRSDLSWEDSVRLDLHYVENWTLGTDVVVLLKTAGAVVKARGAY